MGVGCGLPPTREGGALTFPGRHLTRVVMHYLAAGSLYSVLLLPYTVQYTNMLVNARCRGEDEHGETRRQECVSLTTLFSPPGTLVIFLLVLMLLFGVPVCFTRIVGSPYLSDESV
ncbi:hypothetical protein L209DRAFT_755510 [Thermothelomyces heterothallicus CBS 203.75]